jgi:hypothetical protein
MVAMVLIGTLFLAQVGGNPIVTPPQPQTTTVVNQVTVQVPEPDPQTTAQMAGWSFSGIVVTIIAPTLVKWTNDLLDVPDFVRNTPPDLSYRNDGVRDLVILVRKAALALSLLAIVVWGLTAMLRGYAEMPGRLALGIGLAATELWWWQIGIDLFNALNNTIAAPTVASVVRPHLQVPTLTADPTEAFSPAVLVIATCIVTILLILAMFFRLGMLDILIAIGALALFCKAFEGKGEHAAEAYIGMSIGMLASQTPVVVALKLAPLIGIGGSGVVGTLLGLVILLLARKMPGMLSSRLSNSSSRSGLLSLLFVRRLLARV